MNVEELPENRQIKGLEQLLVIADNALTHIAAKNEVFPMEESAEEWEAIRMEAGIDESFKHPMLSHKEEIKKHLTELVKLTPDILVENRIEKFCAMGVTK